MWRPVCCQGKYLMCVSTMQASIIALEVSFGSFLGAVSTFDTNSNSDWAKLRPVVFLLQILGQNAMDLSLCNERCQAKIFKKLRGKDNWEAQDIWRWDRRFSIRSSTRTLSNPPLSELHSDSTNSTRILSSRSPCCVLLALSWNTTNENPSTDKLSRAIN